MGLHLGGGRINKLRSGIATDALHAFLEESKESMGI